MGSFNTVSEAKKKSQKTFEPVDTQSNATNSKQQSSGDKKKSVAHFDKRRSAKNEEETLQISSPRDQMDMHLPTPIFKTITNDNPRNKFNNENVIESPIAHLKIQNKMNSKSSSHIEELDDANKFSFAQKCLDDAK